MKKELRIKRLNKFFEFKTPCIIITRNLVAHDEFIIVLKKKDSGF